MKEETLYIYFIGQSNVCCFRCRSIENVHVKQFLCNFYSSIQLDVCVYMCSLCTPRSIEIPDRYTPWIRFDGCRNHQVFCQRDIFNQIINISWDSWKVPKFCCYWCVFFNWQFEIGIWNRQFLLCCACRFSSWRVLDFIRLSFRRNGEKFFYGHQKRKQNTHTHGENGNIEHI